MYEISACVLGLYRNSYCGTCQWTYVIAYTSRKINRTSYFVISLYVILYIIEYKKKTNNSDVRLRLPVH